MTSYKRRTIILEYLKTRLAWNKIVLLVNVCLTCLTSTMIGMLGFEYLFFIKERVSRLTI